MLAPEQHALLDELYWNTNQTVTSLCTQFGLTAAQVSKLITPLPAGFDCWRCQQPMSYRSAVSATTLAEPAISPARAAQSNQKASTTRACRQRCGHRRPVVREP
jgi:hypothetical protein